MKGNVVLWVLWRLFRCTSCSLLRCVSNNNNIKNEVCSIDEERSSSVLLCSQSVCLSVFEQKSSDRLTDWRTDKLTDRRTEKEENNATDDGARCGWVSAPSPISVDTLVHRYLTVRFRTVLHCRLNSIVVIHCFNFKFIQLHLIPFHWLTIVENDLIHRNESGCCNHVPKGRCHHQCQRLEHPHSR